MEDEIIHIWEKSRLQGTSARGAGTSGFLGRENSPESAPIATAPGGTGLRRSEKTCPHCKQLKPVSQFRPCKKYKDGLRSWCNKCESRCSMAYHNKNRQKIIEFRRKHLIQSSKWNDRHKRTWIVGIVKRDHPADSICEICCKKSARLSYHHWNESFPSWGLWLCYPCHTGCNFMEKSGLPGKYLELKALVEREHRPSLVGVPNGIGRRSIRNV